MARSIFLFSLIFVFLSSCVSTRLESSRAKKSASMGDFLLASFFDAPYSAPEIKTIEVFFSNEDKDALGKQSKKEIEDFAAQVLSYEDYEISYQIFFNQPAKKLYEKRSEAVKKALVKSGIDKDKISEMENANPENIKNNSAYIEAQMWSKE